MSAPYRMVVAAPGGPEVLRRERFEPGAPKPGEVLLRTTAIGVNFIDTYHRTGLYPASMPLVPGVEGVGVIEAVGEGVTGWRVGDRAGAYTREPGFYATHRLLATGALLPIPDTVSDEGAAALLLKGITAWMLAEPCARVAAGETVFVHGAAGGVGTILVPWLKALGARVLAHAGSPEKAGLVRANGADEAFFGDYATLPRQVRTGTGGEGVATVFDGVGAASWEASLAMLRRRGLMVSFGNASGPVPPVPPLDLTRHGSLFLTRPTAGDYADTGGGYATATARLWTMVGEGRVEAVVGQTYPLEDAAAAHRALEGRRTVGSSVLLP